MPLLSIQDLSVSFATESGRVSIVEHIGFDVEAGEIVGLVGESGCGKSVTAMSIMQLLPPDVSRVDTGQVTFEGTPLVGLDETRMCAIRGDRIGMIFQEPMTSLNPTYTVGFQMVEALRLHRDTGRADARASAVEMLQLVGVSAPERRMDQYPHELSGGLRQRVMIAMALICRPSLLIADEPTTALDVTIQAQILELLLRLKQDLGMAILMITHDLGVVAEFCERVLVMYAGRIVEQASVAELFEAPRHPYTRGLIDAMPRLDSGKGRLATIPGIVPSPGDRSEGCHFADRCARVSDQCRQEHPPLNGAAAHKFACWNPAP